MAKAMTTLNECGILTYSQMARLGMAAPLFLWDYIASRGSKRLRRRRERLAAADA